MDIMKAVCEIKKITARKGNLKFLITDIHYVFKNDSVHTLLNEMKDFLFQL